MGYYDEGDQYWRPRKKRYGRGFLLFTAFLSSMLGGFSVLYMLPTLIESGYISIPGNRAEVAVSSSLMSTDPLETATQVIQVKVESDTVKAVKQVEKAVVGIINIQQMRDFWSQSTEAVESGTGSGVIFTKQNGKAMVITNYHVIKGANDVEVSLANGNRVKGHVLGADPLTDLAVLEIPSAGVETVAVLGSSSQLQVGEPAIAIGNPLGLEFSRTVTQGIISSLDRSMPVDVNEDNQPDWQLDVIQTDAAINPGNSGGALINMSGQVIGINSLKISQTGVEGLGFAIPIDDVKPIIDELIRNGKVKRPYLGIVPRDLQDIPSYHWQETLNLPENISEGVVVMEVMDQGLGSNRLKPYDVIVSMEGEKIADSAALRKFLYTKKAQGDQVKVEFYREGKLLSTSIPLYFE